MNKDNLFDARYKLCEAINDIAVFVYKNNDHFFVNEQDLNQLSAISEKIHEAVNDMNFTIHKIGVKDEVNGRSKIKDSTQCNTDGSRRIYEASKIHYRI